LKKCVFFLSNLARNNRLKSRRRSVIFSIAPGPLRKITIDSLSNVLNLAIERNLTFYDASNAYLAEKENLRLVTQNIDLLKQCKTAITIKEIK